METIRPRVFLDAGVIVAIVAGRKDHHFNVCVKIFEDIISGKVVGVVTYSAMSEVVHALRHRAFKRAQRLGLNMQELDFKDVDKIICAFNKRIFDLKKEGKIIIYISETPDDEYQKSIFEKIFSHPGKIHTYRWCHRCERDQEIINGSTACPHCNSKLKAADRYIYKVLGPKDIEHAYLAKMAGVKIFYTTDRAFEDLRHDPEFAGMEFVILV